MWEDAGTQLFLKRERRKKGRLVQSKLFITINNTVKTSYEQHIYIYTYVTRPHHSTRNIPVNMPDLIQTVMAIKASVQPELGQIIYMPDLTSHIQFGSVLPKKAWIILCKTSLAPIWMAWSGFGQKHLVRKQAGVHESLSLVLAERNRPATSFPPLASVAFRWPGSH